MKKSWDYLELNDFACPPVMLKAGAVLPPISRKNRLREPSTFNFSFQTNRFFTGRDLHKTKIFELEYFEFRTIHM